MPRKSPSRLVVLLSCVLCGGLSGILEAHGGQYRGPSIPGGGPGGRGPATPAGGNAPGTSARDALDGTRWQIWWELNKDPFLQREREATDGPAAGVTERQRREQILPALHKALRSSSNKDMVTACLIALAKLGTDSKELPLLPTLRRYLSRGDQEIRESAALALGISKREAAVPDLTDLLLNRASARRLVGKGRVDDRTRAFAAYGLGLVARASGDVVLRQQVYKSLLQVMTNRRERDRDVRIAVINGIRQLHPADGARNRRLVWQAIEQLRSEMERSPGKSRELVQAHVTPAIARLVGRGHNVEQQRAKAFFAALLRGKRRHPTVFQSAALSLGQVALSQEKEPEDAPISELLQKTFRRHRDHQTRHFALIALGRIGGASNFRWLSALLARQKGPARPWVALAIGLCGHGGLAGGGSEGRDLRSAAGKLLHETLRTNRNRDQNAAICVALGLCRYLEAAEDVRGLARKYGRSDQEPAGYACVSLALMDDKKAAPLISELMLGAERRPVLMAMTATSLARLEHRGATVALQQMLRRRGSFSILPMSSVATGLGLIGDERSVGPLIGLMQDRSEPKLLRAFAAVALGLVADDSDLPWSSWIAQGMNYRAFTPTVSNGQTGVLDIL